MMISTLLLRTGSILAEVEYRRNSSQVAIRDGGSVSDTG